MNLRKRPQSVHISGEDLIKVDLLSKYRVRLNHDKHFFASAQSLGPSIFNQQITETKKKRKSIQIIGKFLKKCQFKRRQCKNGGTQSKRRCSVSSLEFWEEDYMTIKKKTSN